MSNYTPQVSWSGKDALSDSDSEKIISGADFNTEVLALQTAINSKMDVTSGTLTGHTIINGVLNTGVSGTAVLDEDNMSSNSATKLSTQQSIKAYVDSNSLSLIDEDNMSTDSATRPPSQQSVKAFVEGKGYADIGLIIALG